MQNNSNNSFPLHGNVFYCYLEFHHCNNWLKVISSTDIFLSGYSLEKYFLKNATLYNSCRKGVVFMI